ncbi:MAG: transcriptional repressor LexA [Eubacteriales bacterium]|nr:transcriptional repressor LexA [Eubacteriales bacterium]
MKPLTKSQQKVYDYIKECLPDGKIPSVREICNATGLKSTSTVHLHLKTLEERGLIERERGLNRSIRMPGSEKTVSVPVMGRVTAGMPILAVEDVDSYIPVSQSFSRGRELFALRVVGESMINAGIFDGDIVVVHRTPVAENGEIVVALIGDEATVKRFYKENGHFRLQPENDAFEPIVVEEVALLGKVVALYRSFEAFA